MYKALCIGSFECSVNLGAMVVLFFISAVFRKQLGENIDLEFSMIGGTILGIVAFILVFTLTGNLKWSFLSGVGGIIGGGFLGAPFLGDGSSE